MNQSILTVGFVQHVCEDDPAVNMARVVTGIQGVAQQGAQLVLLQELHNHTYFCKTQDPDFFDLAESIPGPTTDRLSEIAGDLRLCVVGSVFERRAPGVYHNTAVVLDRDGSLAGTYRKMHIPDDPGYHEKFYFTPGDLGFRPIDTLVGRLGVLVCWDQWYPEAARLMALAGAEILLFPSAIGWDPVDSTDEQQRQLDSWVTIQRGHAIANGLPLVCCNRIGDEDMPGNGGHIQFWGSSFVCGPQGEILLRAPVNEPKLGTIAIDRRRSESVRRAWPFLRDRRIEGYQNLTRRLSDS